MENLLKEKQVIGFSAYPKYPRYIKGFILDNRDKSFKIVYARKGKINKIYEGRFDLFEHDQLILEFLYEIDPYYDKEEKNIARIESFYSKTTKGVTRIRDKNISLTYLIKYEEIQHFDGNRLLISQNTIILDQDPMALFMDLKDDECLNYYTNFQYQTDIDVKLWKEKTYRTDFYKLIESSAYSFIRTNYKTIFKNDMLNYHLINRKMSDDIFVKYYQTKLPGFEDLCLISVAKDSLMLGKLHDRNEIDCLYIYDHEAVICITINSEYLTMDVSFHDYGVHKGYIERNLLNYQSTIDKLVVFVKNIIQMTP